VKIHIANLTRDTGENQVRKAFEAFGKVDSVKLVPDKELGRPSGFAFVEMPEEAEAKVALEKLHKSQLNGATITLKAVEEEAENVPGFRPGRGPQGAPKHAGKGGGHGFKNTGGAHGGAIRRGGQRGV
jgi:RNA recognition motif-containing protein